MKAFLLSLLLAFTQLAAFGQPAWRERAELPVRSDYSEFRVWPLADSGALVLNEEAAFRRNLVPFTLFKFDHALVPHWQAPLDVPRGSRFLQARIRNQTAYLLFEGLKRDEVLLVRINTGNGFQETGTHLLPEDMPTFKLTDFQLLEERLFLTGLHNERLAVLFLNPAVAEIQKLPALYDQASQLTEFYADTTAGRIEFVLAETNGVRGRLQVKRFDANGKLFSLNFIQDRDKNFLAGRLSPADSAQKLIAGTYSLRDLRYAQGFFTGPLPPQTGTGMKFYDFTAFSHFFDYLKPNRREKLQRKAARFRLTRKVFQLRQRMVVHRLWPYQDGYLMLGELYSPKYQSEGPGNRIFEGFQFTQVIVAALDAKGNLRWENSLPLQNVKFFDVKETVTAGVNKDLVMLCYPDSDKLRYKTMQGSESTPNDLFLELSGSITDGRVLQTYETGTAYWYGNNFLVYGLQKIRSTKGTRHVFFIKKLDFRNNEKELSQSEKP